MKRCTRCRRVISLEEWRELQLVGHMCEPRDEHGPEVHREYRNCPCGSTIIVRVDRRHVGSCTVAPPPPRTPRRHDPAAVPGDEQLAYLLLPATPQIGPERERPTADPDVRLFVSPHGSYRFVGFDAAGAASALQIVSGDGRSGVIANVYTRPDARRRGWAARLLAIARRRFRVVEHSRHLSGAGKAWAAKVR